MLNSLLKRFLFLLGGYVIFVILFILAARFFQNSGILFSFDRAVLNFFISLRHDWLTDIVLVITFLGDIKFVLPVSALLLIWFWLSKRIFHFSLLLVLTAVSAGLVFLLKDFFARIRPGIELRLVSEDSFSFPSGHAMIAIAFWGVLAYLLSKNFSKQWQKTVVIAGGCALIFAISTSRLYLGVHWPTDILGSWILGGAWLAGLIWLSERQFKEIITNKSE